MSNQRFASVWDTFVHGKRRIVMNDSGDSDDWLEKHKPVGFCGALDAGRMALASREGNVWIALHAEPDLRLEVVIAWLDQAEDIETVKSRIQQLATFIDADDDVRFSFGG